MLKRRRWATWAPLFLVALAGCGGGPSNRELCLAIVAAMPVVYVITLGYLWLLETIRGLPDRDPRSIGREAVATTAGIVALSAVVLVIGGRPDLGTVILAVLAFGAVALGTSLVLWRVRRKASYASRILRAAQIGAALGLPASFLWPKALDAVAANYILSMTFASLLFAIYATPLLAMGLLIEAIVRRKR